MTRQTAVAMTMMILFARPPISSPGNPFFCCELPQHPLSPSIKKEEKEKRI